MNFISLPYSSFPLLPLPLPLRKAMSLPTRLLFVSSSKRCCCRSGQTLPAQALLSTFRQPRLAQIHHNLLIPSRPFSFKTIAENMSDSLSQTSVTLDSATTDQEDEEFDIQVHYRRRLHVHIPYHSYNLHVASLEVHGESRGKAPTSPRYRGDTQERGAGSSASH